MNTKKKLLSLLTAITITASAFSGMVIPASAANTGSDPEIEMFAATPVVYEIPAAGTALSAATPLLDNADVTVKITQDAATVATTDSNFHKDTYPNNVAFRALGTVSSHVDDWASTIKDANVSVVVTPKKDITFTSYIGINATKSIRIWDNTENKEVKKQDTTVKGVEAVTQDLTAEHEYLVYTSGTTACVLKLEYTVKGADDPAEPTATTAAAEPTATTEAAEPTATTAAAEPTATTAAAEPTATTAPAEPTATPEAAEQTPAPFSSPLPKVEAKTILFDDLNTYTTTGLTGQGNKDQSATLGKLKLYVGARGSGGDNTSTIAAEKDADNEANYYFKAVSGGYATSGRGASFEADSSAVTIPKYADLADGEFLRLSFDAKYTNAASTIQVFGLTSSKNVGGGGVCNDPVLSVAENPQIVLNEWLHIDLIVDNSKAAYAFITDKDGKLVSVKSFTADGEALGKIAFYGAASTVYLDNIGIYTGGFEAAPLSVTVATAAGEALADVDVTIGRAAYKTDENGKVDVIVPAGTYAIKAEKTGYEATAGKEDAAETSAVVEAYTPSSPSLTLNKQKYTPVPETVTIEGAPLVMTAPNSAEKVDGQPLTAKVIDQKNIEITGSDVSVVWSIAPADDKVSVDPATGVVSIAKGYSAGDTHVKEFTVTATATANGESKSADAKIGISDYLFYEPGVNAASYGGVVNKLNTDGGTYISIPTTASSATMTLPDPVELANGTVQNMKFNVRIDKQDIYTFARYFDIKDSAGKSLVTPIYVDGAAIGINGSYNSTNKNWEWADRPFGTLSVNTWVPVEVLFKTNGYGVTTARFTVGDQEPVTVTVDEDAIDIASITFSAANANGDRVVGFKDIIIEERATTDLAITGAKQVAKVSGAEVKRTYAADPLILEENEKFTYSLKEAAEGVSIDAATGVLTVTDAAAPGKVTVVTTSSVSTAEKPKTAEMEVEIKDFANVKSYNFSGPETIEVNGSAKYSVTDIVDEYGDAADMPVTYSVVSADAEAAVQFTGLTATEAVVIVAEYKDGVLTSVSTEAAAIADGACTVKGAVGAKVMLWKSLESMEPVAESKTIAASEAIAEIDAETGELTIPKDAQGSFKVIAEIGNPEKTVKAEKTVTVASYSVVKDVPANTESMDIDISGLTLAESVSGLRLTTAKGGVLVAQTEVAVPEGKTVTVSTAGADKVEVSPIYTFGAEGESNDISSTGYTAYVPDASYDFTVKKATTGRADVFVNGYLVGQNVDQSDDGKGSRSITEGALYQVNDIKTSGGKANVTMHSNDTNVEYVVIKKTPSIVTRKPHVYVLGDSLVATYYGEPTKKLENGEPGPGNARTGWGQLLQNYLSSDLVVQNWAESGNYARGLYQSTFGSVIQNAEEGDFFILECGYNDANSKNNTSVEDMTYYIEAMFNESKAIGVTPVLVTPNASKHDYKASVARTANLIEIAEKNDVACVDLSGRSYAFFSANYTGSDASTVVGKNYNVYVTNDSGTMTGEDTLHSSYAGAMLHASIVAQGINDLQATRTDLAGLKINKEFSYNFTDTEGKSFTFKVNAAPAE